MTSEPSAAQREQQIEHLIREWRRDIGSLHLPERDYYQELDYIELGVRIEALLDQALADAVAGERQKVIAMLEDTARQCRVSAERSKWVDLREHELCSEYQARILLKAAAALRAGGEA